MNFDSKIETHREERIRANYLRVRERIDQVAHASGHHPDQVILVVVTKGHTIPVVRAVVQAGARHLGENYPEQAVAKVNALSDQHGVKWHMIGHLQSRKARLVCEHFNFLHSLDRLKLGHRLDRFAGEFQRVLPVLLEFNVSGEASKFGWRADDQARWPELLPDVDALLQLPNLDVRGLMTMAPFGAEPQAARAYFARLRGLRDYLAGQFSHAHFTELSMGMSDDFEPAIQEGATIVRIGTAILGSQS